MLPVADKLQDVFGRVLRRRREEAGLSQEELALKAGLNRNYVGMLERGERMASIEVLRKLASGLGCPMSALIIDLERALEPDGGAEQAEQR